MSAVEQADTGRGGLFVGLLKSPRTLVFGGGAVVMAGVIFAVTLSPGAGAGAAVAVAMLVLTVLAIVADSRAEEEFFVGYAGERSLAHSNQKVESARDRPAARGDALLGAVVRRPVAGQARGNPLPVHHRDREPRRGPSGRRMAVHARARGGSGIAELFGELWVFAARA